MHIPSNIPLPTSIAGRFSIIGVIKATIKQDDSSPSMIAYDAFRSVRGEEVYVRLETFTHKLGICKRFENSAGRPLFHGGEICFLVNGNVRVDPGYLAEICPFGHPSETRKRKLVFLRKLGEGGFGKVFLAHDLARSTASKPVFSAVKVQRPTSTAALHLIRSEMIVQRKLSDHRNFVSLHRAFVQDGYFAMIMDLMDGDLHKLLSTDRGALVGDMPRARNIINQLFDAVEYMHKNGLYHWYVSVLSLPPLH